MLFCLAKKLYLQFFNIKIEIILRTFKNDADCQVHPEETKKGKKGQKKKNPTWTIFINESRKNWKGHRIFGNFWNENILFMCSYRHIERQHLSVSLYILFYKCACLLRGKKKSCVCVCGGLNDVSGIPIDLLLARPKGICCFLFLPFARFAFFVVVVFRACSKNIRPSSHQHPV